MAANEDKEWFLPANLLTPEKLEEAAKSQKELALRINSPYAHKSAAEIQRFNAGILIAETEKLLQAIPLNEMHAITREQYAEALAEVGQFHNAAEITRDDQKKDYYTELWHAVWKDDEEVCQCPVQSFAAGETRNNLFAESRVWSVKHNREMSVIKCGCCGDRNVSKLPDSIRREREIRKRNLQMVSGRSHLEAKQILSQLHKR